MTRACLGISRSADHLSCPAVARYQERIKFQIRDPYAHSYSDEAKRLRSILESVEFECELISGNFWTPVERSFRQLNGMASLEYFGFTCRFTIDVAAWDLNHSQVRWDYELAQLGGTYALRMAGLRTKRFICHANGLNDSLVFHAKFIAFGRKGLKDRSLNGFVVVLGCRLPFKN